MRPEFTWLKNLDSSWGIFGEQFDILHMITGWLIVEMMATCIFIFKEKY